MDISYSRIANSTIITITNNSGLSVSLSEIGAGIACVKLHDAHLSYEPADIERYLDCGAGGYYGKTVGPIAGRVKNGKSLMNNEPFQLECNEGANCLHSASLGLDKKHFSSEVSDKEDSVSVIFTFRSEKEENYCLPLDVLVCYEISKDENEFSCEIKAKSPVDLPLNLTNHVYWNLGDEENLLTNLLTVKASKVGSYDDEMIALSIVDVSETLDFRQAKLLGKDLFDKAIYQRRFHGYDHGFVFDEIKKDEANCILENDKYRLEFFTDAPAVQIYTNNYPRTTEKMASGKYDRPHAAITFEPVAVPGNPDSFIQKANSIWARRFSYAFYEKEEQ